MKDLYEEELKRKHQEVISLMNNQHKQSEILLRKIIAPMWQVEGKAFIDETQQASWDALVKKEAKISKNYGSLIAESLKVMRSIEINGVDAAIRDLVDLESDLSKVVAIVNRFSIKGNEFTKTLVENNPKILKVYPELSKIVKKNSSVSSENRDAYNKKGLEEAIEYIDVLVSDLKVKDMIKQAIVSENEELKNIATKRNEMGKVRK